MCAVACVWCVSNFLAAMSQTLAAIVLIVPGSPLAFKSQSTCKLPGGETHERQYHQIFGTIQYRCLPRRIIYVYTHAHTHARTHTHTAVSPIPRARCLMHGRHLSSRTCAVHVRDSSHASYPGAVPITCFPFPIVLDRAVGSPLPGSARRGMPCDDPCCCPAGPLPSWPSLLLPYFS